MLMIRLQRVGRKNDPSFRIIVTDKRRAAKAGRALEVLGAYDARQTAKGEARPMTINAARAKHWLEHGAQLSGTAHNLFVDQKIVPGPKRNVRPSKKATVAAVAPATV